MKRTITKRFGEYPFAHRQPRHDGHCAKLHGHNWSFEVTFSAVVLDENNFIIDFGKMKSLKEKFTNLFDHTIVLQADDPLQHTIRDFCHKHGVGVTTLVPSASCEGLAEYVCGLTALWLIEGGYYPRVSIERVEVFEDEKNSAVFNPSPEMLTPEFFQHRILETV
jgi:6-pyruvoyltetrahydropterin/6-carboxytetrahydropterin synthase